MWQKYIEDSGINTAHLLVPKDSELIFVQFASRAILLNALSIFYVKKT